jgi:hypothetical protein
MLSRPQVFDHISKSKINEWAEDALLGEWRVMLADESGVDGGGLRREVISLYFEQLESSPLVLRTSTDASLPPTLFVACRQGAEYSPMQWRQIWSSIGAMVLRSVVHFGNAPVAFSSILFDCAFGRIAKMPPDIPNDDSDEVGEVLRMREARGDEWARSELMDWLRRLRTADPHKESGYRWMLRERRLKLTSSLNSGSAVNRSNNQDTYAVSAGALQTMEAMLEPCSYTLLVQSSHMAPDGTAEQSGLIMEWALLWDVYLKFIGSGDRWLAYEAFLDGLTARGRRFDLWASLTGEQVIEALEGVALTPEVVQSNLEFKPNYGYAKQIEFFSNILDGFSADDLSMFLRFATGIGKLPASRRFPSGQKLAIRFIPDSLEKLPTAHTCSWVVDIPNYDTEAMMRQKLRQAIAAPQPFALS